MSASSSSSYMHAAVAFNKVAGTLSLHTDETVQWVPSSASSGVSGFHLKFCDIAGLQTSKAGAAQIALMLVLANAVQIASKSKVLLVFNAAQQTALEDRERFKTELAAAVGRNRASMDGASGGATPSSLPGSPAQACSPAATATATATAATRGATPDTRAATPSRIAPPASAKQPRLNDTARRKTEIELRISVIKSNASLRALHKDIVISGEMSDAEFWSHPQRQRLVRAERAKLEQRAGRNARLADPKPTPNEAGELKLSITPELIRDLFEQFPIVARAYQDNVPSKLDQASFWTRYFQSKLYHRLRTSARSAASEHIVHDDAIFDAYLEDEDNELQPRREFNPHDRLLDLQATEEDHAETGNEKDWTMRAGAERRTLPLMRRFNDHSQSLLDSALGEQERGQSKRRIVGGVGDEYPTATHSARQGDANSAQHTSSAHDADQVDDSVDWIKKHYYREIVIDDLNDSVATDKVRLNMADLEGYFSTTVQGGDEAVSSARLNGAEDEKAVLTMHEYVAVVHKFTQTMRAWGGVQLGGFRPSAQATEACMMRIMQNLRSRTRPAQTSHTSVVPDQVFKSVISLQASTTEFLRQFWNAIAPQPDMSDHPPHRPSHNDPSIQDRLLTAKKMALNLANFHTKLDAIFPPSHPDADDVLHNIDALLAPTKNAVHIALTIARRRAMI